MMRSKLPTSTVRNLFLPFKINLIFTAENIYLITQENTQEIRLKKLLILKSESTNLRN